MDANKIHSTKIILLGSTLSGKTSITQRMVNNIFDKTINTTNGAQFIMKSYYMPL
jgi:GTPase SAR1 family protein